MIKNILLWLLEYYIKHYFTQEERWEFDVQGKGKVYVIVGFQPNTNKKFEKIS